MSMGTRQHRQRQEDLWISHNELPQSPIDGGAIIDHMPPRERRRVAVQK